ncbi:MAG: hypothetical protein Q9192_002358 [Flavoplaca navasiana]
MLECDEDALVKDRKSVRKAIDSASLDMVAVPTTNGVLTRSILVSGMGLASSWTESCYSSRAEKVQQAVELWLPGK